MQRMLAIGSDRRRLREPTHRPRQERGRELVHCREWRARQRGACSLR